MQKTTFVAKASVTDFLQSDLSSVVSCSDLELSDWAKSVASVFNSADPQSQPDLLMMRSILVSEGMNLNDDVFLRSELMNSRSTGAHKPVNIEHADDVIVGHMLSTYAVNKSGTIVDGPDLPLQPIDIVNEAVIYSYLFPQLANDVRELTLSNDLFVSVEAWFDSFDYVVGTNIIKRNESTAEILDSALRMNGGDGYFQGHKVGRVLRNIRFGGVGIVASPANPESIILSVGTDVENPMAHEVETQESILAANIMGCAKKEELAMSNNHSEPFTASAEIDSATQESDNNKLNKSAINSMLERVSASVSQAEKNVSEIDSKMTSLDEQESLLSRMKELAGVGLSKAMIDSRSDRISSMSEEEFNEYLGDVADLVRGNQGSTEESVELGETANETDTNEETLEQDLTENDAVETTEDLSDVDSTEETQESNVSETETKESLEVETNDDSASEQSDTDNSSEENTTDEVVTETSEETVLEDTTETKEASEETSLDNTPEVDLTEEEVVNVVVTETSEEEAVVEDESTEDLAEVDLESIIPISPELGLPSAEDSDNYTEKLSEVITNLLNQRKR